MEFCNCSRLGSGGLLRQRLPGFFPHRRGRAHREDGQCPTSSFELRRETSGAQSSASLFGILGPTGCAPGRCEPACSWQPRFEFSHPMRLVCGGRAATGVERIRVEYMCTQEDLRLQLEGYVLGAGDHAPGFVALTPSESAMAADTVPTLLADEGGVAPSNRLVDLRYEGVFATEPRPPAPVHRPVIPLR